MGDLVLNVNGAQVSVNAPADEPLLWVLRNRLHLTGTRYGCGEGQCGACTVLLDGRATRSCLTPVGAAANSKIVTIEGLEHDGKLSAVQQAFLDEGAFQCGYCTSGMILSATALLRAGANPERERDCYGHEWECVPVRNVPAHSCSHPTRRAASARSRTMSPRTEFDLEFNEGGVLGSAGRTRVRSP